MQRVFNISKWSHISSGKALEFAGDRPRKVVLEVNSPGTAILSVLERDSNKFLARVTGRDTVEFYVTGPFWIASTGSDCYIYTADGDGVTYKTLDAESFTVVRERKQINPELEYVLRRVQDNMSRKLQQQAVDLERAFNRRMGALTLQSAPPVAPVRDAPEEDDAGDDGAADGAEPVVQPSVGKPRGRARNG